MEKLQQLVSTLEAQHSNKADYVLPAESIYMQGGLIQSGHGDLPRIYTPNEVMHEGLSERLEIPLGYYRRMKAQRPELLDTSVTEWLKHMGGKEPLRFRRDFCFIMHSSYLGISKQDGERETHATGMYSVGSLDNMAHHMADMMMVDNDIAHMIFHAVHVYGMLAAKKAGGNGGGVG